MRRATQCATRCCGMRSNPASLNPMGIGGFSNALVVAVFGVWSVALSIYDVRARRLPDPLTLPPAAVALAACACWPELCWGLAWPAVYLLAGSGIGGGDIKLAVSLGVACASVAGPLGVIGAVGLSGANSVALAWWSRQQTVPHGPSMLCAAWAVVLPLCMYSGV